VAPCGWAGTADGDRLDRVTPETAADATWEAAADTLYALDPAAFIPARDEVARTLKAAGNDGVAKQVKALKKPSLAAWALNQLVREDRVQVDALLAIGGELRQAQSALSGDDLRALTGQRHKVVRAVAVRAADLARAAGHPLSPTLVEQVARSLDAALTDPQAAAALVEGRLVTDLAYAGLGGLAAVGFPALTLVRDSGATDDAPSESAAAKANRRKALAVAEHAASEAEAALETAEDSLARAKEAADAANLRAATAEETVTAAQAELEAAQQAEQVAERALALADKTYDRAGTRHADAQARLDDLRR
jgi:hypothetical protein